MIKNLSSTIRFLVFLIITSVLLSAGAASGQSALQVKSGEIGGYDPAAQISGEVSGFDPKGATGTSGELSGVDPIFRIAGDAATPGSVNSGGAIGVNSSPIDSGELSGIDASGAAHRVDHDNGVPFISDRGREDYRTWLQWYSPKAFAISENGKWYGAHGNLSSDPTVPTDPSQRALQFCEKRAKMPCKLYAVDRSVVFGQEMAAAPK